MLGFFFLRLVFSYITMLASYTYIKLISFDHFWWWTHNAFVRQGSPAVVLTPQWLLDAMAQAPMDQLGGSSPLSKWVITPVINGISRVNPLITGVITHLLSGMSHQAVGWMISLDTFLVVPLVKFKKLGWKKKKLFQIKAQLVISLMMVTLWYFF